MEDEYCCINEGTLAAYLVLFSLDDRDAHVMSGRADIFVLLAIEQVQSNHVDLSVAVLASLGS